MVVGCTLRKLENRPFLGHTVEHVLQRSAATVVAVVLPPHHDQHDESNDTQDQPENEVLVAKRGERRYKKQL